LRVLVWWYKSMYVCVAVLVWWYQEGYIKWKQKRDRMKVEVIHLVIKLLLSSHRKLRCLLC